MTYIHDGESRRGEDTDVASEAAVTSGLGGVRTLGGVTNGFSVGGFVTVLIGFVVSSLSTIALTLVGLASLALGYQVGRQLLADDRVRYGSIDMFGGVGLAAALVGALGLLNVPWEFSSFTVGTGVFATGFLCYIAVWEYGRWRMFRDDVPANSAAD